MKDLEKIQKMFNLFEVGDVVKGSIVSVFDEGAKVKTSGGCYGNIIGKIPDTLIESSAVEVVVSDVKDGLPVFELTADFLFDKVPQKAAVCFVSPRAVIVEFEAKAGIYGSYEPAGGLAAELKTLGADDKVIVSELKKSNDREYYRIGRLELPQTPVEAPKASAGNAEPEKNENDMLKPWPKDKIEEVFRKGSRKMYGKVALGKVYTVTPYGKSGREVQFPDGQVGDLNDGFPKGWPRAMVRVVFISQSNRPKAELIRGEAEPPAGGTASNKASKDGKNKFRNEEVFRQGLAKGSCYRAGGYWLGYNYKVEIKNNLPYFTPTGEDPKNILERARVIVNPGGEAFKEGDRVCAEIAFIRREGNTHNYTFEVNVLKIF